MSVAQFGDLRVPYRTSQDFPADEVTGRGTEARTVAFTAPMRVSEDELVAALWRGMFGEDGEVLDDDAEVRDIVADQLVNGGMTEMDSALAEMAAAVPGSEDYAHVTQYRAVIRRAFASVLPATSANVAGARTARGRELAGVV